MADGENGYCSLADVQAITAKTYGAATTPTNAQVNVFVDQRGAEIYSVLRGIIGSTAPGPSGSDYDTQLGTANDLERSLTRVTRLANQIGSAADALEAAAIGETPNRSERVEELRDQYQKMLSTDEDEPGPLVVAATELAESLTAIAANHFNTGEVDRPDIVTQNGQGLVVTSETEF
jgi:hypothetical protein